MVSRGWLVSWLLRVDSGSLVGNVGNIAVIAVGGVLHVLDPEVGLEVSDAVRDENNSDGARSRSHGLVNQ